MKRTYLALGLGLALAALGLIAVLEPTQVVLGYLRGEPFFRGRPAGYWKRALRASDPATQAEALRAFDEGGEAAVPVLAALRRQGGASEWEATEARLQAADLLRKLGSEATDATASLVEVLGDEDAHVRAVAASAVAALASVPAEAVPALIALLPAGDQASVSAARALGKIGPDARAAIPALTEATGANDLEVRRAAIKALGKIGPDARGAVPVLTRGLKDENDYVREHSAESLGQIGPDARDAVPVLVEALKDKVARVRRDAARSLGQIGPAAGSAVPSLKALLKDENDLVRLAAAGALRRLASGADGGSIP